MLLRPLKTDDAAHVAQLHIEGISSGFISSLGQAFVTKLYEVIAASEDSFGLVAEDSGKVVGFVAFSSNLSSLYKFVLWHGGAKMFFLLAGKMFSFSRLKRIVQNILYPSKMAKLELPQAELLSIVIAPKARGQGLAPELVQAGLNECANRGIDKVKVLVADANKSANKLYRKCGFEMARRINSHGVASNIYVAKTTL